MDTFLKGDGGNTFWYSQIILLISLTFLLISPISAIFFIGLVLINNADISPKARIILALIMSVSLSIIAGARPVLGEDSNDIKGYYYIYQQISEGDLNYLTHFGAGIEVGLPALMYLFVIFLPALTINGLMLSLSIFCSILLVIWIEVTFYRKNEYRGSMLVGIFIILINFYFSTQLVRQFISLVILLFAMSNKKTSRRYLYLTIATSFHITAIPFYIAYRVMKTGIIGQIFIILLMLVFVYVFGYIYFVFDILPPAISEKIIYYIGNEESYTLADIESLRMIVVMCSISLLVVLACKFKIKINTWKWMAIPWLAAIIHIILLPIPLASLRSTLIITSIIPGLLIYKMFDAGGFFVKNLKIIFINLLFFYKIAGYIFADNFRNIDYTLNMIKVF